MSGHWDSNPEIARTPCVNVAVTPCPDARYRGEGEDLFQLGQRFYAFSTRQNPLARERLISRSIHIRRHIEPLQIWIFSFLDSAVVFASELG